MCSNDLSCSKTFHMSLFLISTMVVAVFALCGVLISYWICSSWLRSLRIVDGRCADCGYASTSSVAQAGLCCFECGLANDTERSLHVRRASTGGFILMFSVSCSIYFGIWVDRLILMTYKVGGAGWSLNLLQETLLTSGFSTLCMGSAVGILFRVLYASRRFE